MTQSNVNRKLANLGVSLINVDASKGYLTQSKSKTNSPLHGVRDNNLLSLQTINNNQSEEALSGAANSTSLLSPTNNNPNSANISQHSARMKYYFHKKHNHFLDYFDEIVPNDAIICVSDVPFQYNKREGQYTELIGNPTGTTFVATKRVRQKK